MSNNNKSVLSWLQEFKNLKWVGDKQLDFLVWKSQVQEQT